MMRADDKSRAPWPTSAVAALLIATSIMSGCLTANYGTAPYIELSDPPISGMASEERVATELCSGFGESIRGINELLFTAEQEHPGLLGLENYALSWRNNAGGPCVEISGTPLYPEAYER